jgi:hypothetical protein
MAGTDLGRIGPGPEGKPIWDDGGPIKGDIYYISVWKPMTPIWGTRFWEAESNVFILLSFCDAGYVQNCTGLK